MNAGDFSTEQLAGQRLLVGFEGTVFNDETARLVDTLKVAGVILFAGNVAGPDQIRRLCEDLQGHARACGQPPLLIAIDQEGGQVARLKAPFTRFPGNPAMTGEPDAERFARVTAAELKSVGINMNLAPVLDVAPAGADSVMAGRAFGGGPERVARLGCRVIERLQRNGVMAVAKHFPGIGRTTLDSHLDQPVLDTSPTELADVDLPPFAAAIRGGVAGVMLSHVRYTGIDDRWPASLSRRVAGDLLRERMGYRGVVMTDDLDMGSIHGRYDMETVMGRVIAADVDLALICHRGPGIDDGFAAVHAGIRRSSDAARRARASVDRVLRLKAAYLRPLRTNGGNGGPGDSR